jgi:hypothetical protein
MSMMALELSAFARFVPGSAPQKADTDLRRLSGLAVALSARTL